MSRYTLKTYCGEKPLERYDHRSSGKLRDILEHPKHHCAGQIGPWGEIENHADRFEILDSLQVKIFNGNIEEALNFVRSMR